jgi:hypothetical protein
MLRDFPHAAMGVNRNISSAHPHRSWLADQTGEIQYASVYLRMRQITARFVVPS